MKTHALQDVAADEAIDAPLVRVCGRWAEVEPRSQDDLRQGRCQRGLMR